MIRAIGHVRNPLHRRAWRNAAPSRHEPEHHRIAALTRRELLGIRAHLGESRGIDAARKIASPDLRKSALEKVFGSWAESEPRNATEAALQLPPGGERMALIERVIPALAKKDAEGALALLDRLEPGVERSRSLDPMLSALAKRNPIAALERGMDEYAGTDGDVSAHQIFQHIERGGMILLPQMSNACAIASVRPLLRGISSATRAASEPSRRAHSRKTLRPCVAG